MTGAEIVKEWERRQQAGCYSSYDQSMADIAAMIDKAIKPTENPVDNQTDRNEWDYREEQARLRAAGFDAYNCDMVDEFPRW